MHARPVDPRDQRWEHSPDRFRVHFFRKTHPMAGSWASDEWELASSDVRDVISWAEAERPRRGDFVIYAVLPWPGTAGGLGLVRLAGTDPNDSGHGDPGRHGVGSGSS